MKAMVLYVAVVQVQQHPLLVGWWGKKYCKHSSTSLAVNVVLLRLIFLLLNFTDHSMILQMSSSPASWKQWYSWKRCNWSLRNSSEIAMALFPPQRKCLNERRCPFVSDMYMANMLKWSLLQNFSSMIPQFLVSWKVSDVVSSKIFLKGEV